MAISDYYSSAISAYGANSQNGPSLNQSKLAKFAKITLLALGVILAVGAIVGSALATHGVSLIALGVVGKIVAANSSVFLGTGLGVFLSSLAAGFYCVKKNKLESLESLGIRIDDTIHEHERINVSGLKEIDCESGFIKKLQLGEKEISIPKNEEGFDKNQGVLKIFNQQIQELQFSIEKVDGTKVKTMDELRSILDVSKEDFGIGNDKGNMDKVKIVLLHYLNNNCSVLSLDEIEPGKDFLEEDMSVRLLANESGKIDGLEIKGSITINNIKENRTLTMSFNA